jgi:hypothetical protein
MPANRISQLVLPRAILLSKAFVAPLTHRRFA